MANHISIYWFVEVLRWMWGFGDIIKWARIFRFIICYTTPTTRVYAIYRTPLGCYENLIRPRGYKAWVHSQTQNKAQWLAVCGHVSASSQSLRFIFSLSLYSSFITSRPDLIYLFTLVVGMYTVFCCFSTSLDCSKWIEIALYSSDSKVWIFEHVCQLSC